MKLERWTGMLHRLANVVSLHDDPISSIALDWDVPLTPSADAHHQGHSAEYARAKGHCVPPYDVPGQLTRDSDRSSTPPVGRSHIKSQLDRAMPLPIKISSATTWMMEMFCLFLRQLEAGDARDDDDKVENGEDNDASGG